MTSFALPHASNVFSSPTTPYLLVAAGVSILRSVDMNGSEWETLVEDDYGGITSLDYHYKYV